MNRTPGSSTSYYLLEMSQRILKEYSLLLRNPSTTPEEIENLYLSIKNIKRDREYLIKGIKKLKDNIAIATLKPSLLQVLGSERQVPIWAFQDLDWKSKILCVVAFKDMKELHNYDFDWICSSAPNFANSIPEKFFFGTELSKRMLAIATRSDLSRTGHELINSLSSYPQS